MYIKENFFELSVEWLLTISQSSVITSGTLGPVGRFLSAQQKSTIQGGHLDSGRKSLQFVNWIFDCSAKIEFTDSGMFVLSWF